MEAKAIVEEAAAMSQLSLDIINTNSSDVENDNTGKPTSDLSLAMRGR